jgi:hypothetical protein
VEPVTWHQGWRKIAGTGDSPTAGTSEHHAATGQNPAGHFPERRAQFGVEHRVRLSTEPPVLMADGSREEQYLTASLEQQGDDAVPRVMIGHNVSAGVGATLNEARRFALDILALVDQQDVSG